LGWEEDWVFLRNHRKKKERKNINYEKKGRGEKIIKIKIKKDKEERQRKEGPLLSSIREAREKEKKRTKGVCALVCG
jgi:hypothetical protein